MRREKRMASHVGDNVDRWRPRVNRDIDLSESPLAAFDHIFKQEMLGIERIMYPLDH
jgi:hypothetical protein